MATLTDALLDDLDDLSDHDDYDNGIDHDTNDEYEFSAHILDDADHEDADAVVQQERETEREGNSSSRSHPTDTTISIFTTALRKATKRRRLLDDASLIRHLDEIQRHPSSSSDCRRLPNDRNDNNYNNNYDYPSIVESNRQLGRLGEEVMRAHAELAALYHARFPELEEIVPHPRQYLKVVQIIEHIHVSDDATTTNTNENENESENQQEEEEEKEEANSISQKQWQPQQEATTGAFTTHSLDLARHNDALNRVLTSPHQVLTLSVAASSTRHGRPLHPHERAQVVQCVQYCNRVVSVHDTIQQFVAAHMNLLAPNCCALMGAELTAQLVGYVCSSHSHASYNHTTRTDDDAVGNNGSLEELSKIPACNLQVLGQHRHSTASLSISSHASNSTTHPHEGILMQCDLIQTLPRVYQHKALKTVAAKLALAIRCDLAYHPTQMMTATTTTTASTSTTKSKSSASASASANANGEHDNGHNDLNDTFETTGAAGREFRRQCQAKFQQWQEPTRAPTLKALLKPDLLIKKRRGGTRVRRMKQKYAETTLMKQANTRAFSTATGEYGDDAMGRTRGLLDVYSTSSSSGSGGGGGGIGTFLPPHTGRTSLLSNTHTTTTTTTQTVSSRKQQQEEGGGMTTSLVFTPVQGMELVNPDRNRDRVAAANRKWFGDQTGFRSALPKSS